MGGEGVMFTAAPSPAQATHPHQPTVTGTCYDVFHTCPFSVHETGFPVTLALSREGADPWPPHAHPLKSV